MALVFGKDAVLFRWDSSWVEIGNVKDLTLNLETGETDVTTRANSGWRAVAPTLKDASVEWEMIWDTSDSDFTAIKDAYFAGTSIKLRVMSGSAGGSQGLEAEFAIMSFSRNEALEEALTISVTARPTYAPSTPPVWATI